MRSDAILLPAGLQLSDKYRLALDEWRELHQELSDLGIGGIELTEWPDGLWSCTFGIYPSGALAVDLGNMTVAEWFRREQRLRAPFWA